MPDRLRLFQPRGVVRALIWCVLVTAALAWPIAFPYVPPRGLAVREDTSGFAMFEMSGDPHEAILAAVARGELTVSDLQEGFRLYARGNLSAGQLRNRIETGRRVVASYLAEQRSRARPFLIALLGALALLLPALVLGGRALWQRSVSPLPRRR